MDSARVWIAVCGAGTKSILLCHVARVNFLLLPLGRPSRQKPWKVLTASMGIGSH